MQYTEGTVEFTQGSQSVTGTGTNWLSPAVKIGQEICLASQPLAYYVIGFVDYDLQEITLTSSYAGLSNSSAQYIITTEYTANLNLPEPDVSDLEIAAMITRAFRKLDNDVIATVDIGSTVQAYDSTILVDADIGVSVQAYDSTILVDADIGVSVQAYDATILVDADIGVNVEAYDSTILKDADIGVSVQAFGSYEPADATILKDADIGSTVQAYDSTMLVDADIGVNVEAYDATILKDADIGSTVAAALGTDDNYVTDAEKTNLHAPGSDDQAASDVLNTPAGFIAATTVQAAINELDDEKLTKLALTTARNSSFSSSAVFRSADVQECSTALTVTLETYTNRVAGFQFAVQAIGGNVTFAGTFVGEGDFTVLAQGSVAWIKRGTTSWYVYGVTI